MGCVPCSDQDKIVHGITFVCDVCEAEIGECEHTKTKPYKVHIRGLPEVPYIAEETPLFEQTLIERKPYEMPKGGILTQGSIFPDDGKPKNTTSLREYLGHNQDEGRCPHAMFYSGAGACPQCGRGAE